MFYREDLDIVCVTGLLNNSISDSEILPYNYTTFRRDRSHNRIGGGVLISMKSTSFKNVSIFPHEFDELEILTLLCTTHLNQKLLLCCCYRPPDTNVVWFDCFAKFLGTINVLNHRIIITCDFNLPKLFSRDDANILDLLITNIPELLCITDVLTPDQMGICTDHNVLVFDIQMAVTAPPKLSRYVYNFPKGDISGLRNNLTNDCLLSCISDGHEDVNLDWSNWKETFISIVDQFIP